MLVAGIHLNSSFYPWFDGVFEQLVSAKAEGVLAHALIFSGSEGMGKYDFALKFAYSLLCVGPDKPASGVVCGKCKSCHLNMAESHPDLVVCQPEEKSKFIKVDQVRAISQFVAQSPQIGVIKIVVINPATALNINAANALLKSLEEPAGNTLYLLIDNQKQTLLPTIRSRCQIVKLNRPGQSQAIDWLQQAVSEAGEAVCSPTELHLALKMANGSPLKALELIENKGVEAELKLIEHLANVLKGKESVVAFAETFDKGFPFGLEQFLLCQNNWIETMLRYKMTSDPECFKGVSGAAMFKYLADKNDGRLLFALRDELTQRRRDWLSGANYNEKLFIETIAIKWQKLLTGQ